MRLTFASPSWLITTLLCPTAHSWVNVAGFLSSSEKTGPFERDTFPWYSILVTYNLICCVIPLSHVILSDSSISSHLGNTFYELKRRTFPLRTDLVYLNVGTLSVKRRSCLWKGKSKKGKYEFSDSKRMINDSLDSDFCVGAHARLCEGVQCMIYGRPVLYRAP